jgi:O-antigen/teichoic acid export membrane protein
MNIAGWFRDRAVRKVAKYGLPVAIGKFVMSFSGLITLGVLTRHLGPAKFGVIALYRTVLTVVDQYANFNTWQSIIKIGAEQLAAGRPNELRRIIKLAFSIDVATGILGFLVVAALAVLIPDRFDWSSHEANLCMLYGVVLLSRVTGTSDGIFRICDAYRIQAIAGGAGAVFMTVLVVVAVLLHASFTGCVMALIAGEVASNLATTFSSFWVARRAGHGSWMRTSLTGIRRDHPGIVRFLVATNAQLTVRTTQGELDMLVVGSVLGKSAAGLYRVVKQVGAIPGKIFMPFEQVLFTELSRAAAVHDYRGFRSLLRRTVAIGTGGALIIWIVVAAGARTLVQMIAGSAFIEAAEPMRWFLLAMVLQIAVAPVMRAMIALGRPGTLFVFDTSALAVLSVLVIGGALKYGLVGVALAIVVHKTLQLGWSTVWVHRHTRQREREQLLGDPADAGAAT